MARGGVRFSFTKQGKYAKIKKGYQRFFEQYEKERELSSYGGG